jgi:hypothetical protein
MAITDPTPDNIRKLVELRTKSKELLKKHEHCLPVRLTTFGEDYVTSYYCPECGHPKPGHHDACAWGLLVKDH